MLPASMERHSFSVRFYRYFVASGFFLKRELVGAVSEARRIQARPSHSNTKRKRPFLRQQSTGRDHHDNALELQEAARKPIGCY